MRGSAIGAAPRDVDVIEERAQNQGGFLLHQADFGTHNRDGNV